jgi:DNA-binding MarR family transcriptional regulator
MSSYDEFADDLHHVWHQLRRATRPTSRGDLTPEQVWLLGHLREVGSRSVGELACALGVTQSAATMACQRLERAGLVTRSRSLADERIVNVALTTAGSERIDEWQQRKRAEAAQLLDSLSPQEATELQRLLRKILGATRDSPTLSAFVWSLASLAETLA